MTKSRSVSVSTALHRPARMRQSLSLPPIRTAADVLEASSTVIAALAAGEVTPDESGRLMAILSAHRPIVETHDLEARPRCAGGAKEMRALAKRLRALETIIRKSDQTYRPCHQIIWHVGQSWDDALAAYGVDRIAPGDNISLRPVVDADDGTPVRDPIRERDTPKTEAWLKAREYALADKYRRNLG